MSLQSHPGLESQRVPGELLAQVAILDKLDLRPISAMGCMNLPARVREGGEKSSPFSGDHYQKNVLNIGWVFCLE